jgi:aerobic-type carbon monoxide dehydrogenase small subunit (CoxS/CutS family)
VLALLDNDLAFCGYCMSGDHTKALIGQLIIFNQILGELREDIREQVSCVCVGLYKCMHAACVCVCILYVIVHFH